MQELAKSPFFSIIIPVYNVAPYLRECLDSVLAQTFTDWEAICVDDGSTDGSGAILDEYAAKDGRFKIIHQQNAGVSAARNRAMNSSIGEYLLFMDPDDYYPTHYVFSSIFKEIAKTNAIVIGGNIRNVTFNGKFVSDTVAPRCGEAYYSETQQCYGFTGYAYNRAFILENHIKFPNLTYYEDPPFLAQALSMAQRYWLIKSLTYCYRLKRAVSPIDWIGHNGRKLRDKLFGIRQVAKIAQENHLSKLYVQNARHLADAGSFFDDKSIILFHIELRDFCTELRKSRLMDSYQGFCLLREMSKGRIQVLKRMPMFCRVLGVKNFMWIIQGIPTFVIKRILFHKGRETYERI